MKRWLKIGLYLIVTVVVLVAAAITATVGWRPFIGPKARPLTNRTFEKTPERLARGEYLVNNVAGCFGCHGEHEWTQHDAPLLPGTMGAGYASFPEKGLPGVVVPPNITPDPETGAGNWTDDQLARAIREGIGHDGRALFFMPYQAYSHLSDEDLASIIVYIRSIPPLRKALPKTELIFPVKYLIRIAPQPITEPVPAPDLSTPVSRGKYLATIADCRGCHTPINEKGEPLAGLEFGGGFAFDGPWGKLASANITPDATGIPYYDEAMFIETIRTGFVKGARKINQVMPWSEFRHMTDEDLQAIFAYLKTLPPVQHRVDNTEPPTMCKRCGFAHGLGEQN